MNTYRIKSIDLLRGLVMIIMALDHARDYFHFDAFLHDPLDLATTTPLLYFTRWITHFCAPVFVFLAGTSTYLQGLRKSKSELSLFLMKRGLWLVIVELVIMAFVLTFDIHYNTIILQTIWAIGISMFFLGILIRLPYNAILILGSIIVSGHNMLDYAEANHQGAFGFLWDLTHRGNFATYHLWANHNLVIIYPFVPWLGTMMLGYCMGRMFEPSKTPQDRKKTLIRSGIGLILFFVAVRAINIYGDPHPWSIQRSGMFTFLSFMDVHKYPPSLLYLCITIGPALLFLAFFETASNRIARIISVYGRVPFLYYILHFFTLHFLCMISFLMRGHSFAEGMRGIPNLPFKFFIPGEGLHLWATYLVWISVVIVLYPVCKWFSDYKSRNKKWWLSYM